MATIIEIEARIQEHEKRLVELKQDPVHNIREIATTQSLIGFWRNQKIKASANKKSQS
jgi:hypothetical protein